MRITCIYGGASYTPQIQALKQGAPVVVGTPGRVIDLVKRGKLDLSKVESVVLDEADEMLRMGFIDDVNFIFDQLLPSVRSCSSPQRCRTRFERWPKRT